MRKTSKCKETVLRDKRLTDTEKPQREDIMLKAAENKTPERNVEPVLTIENLDHEERMIIKITKRRENNRAGKTNREN